MNDADDIVKEFLVESYENLDRLDRDLITLEKNPKDSDILASIFRTIHTIKGTSGFLGFGKLGAVAHIGESLLGRLRDGTLVLDGEITTALLAMVDAIRQMLASIEAQGSEGERDDSALISTLTRLQHDPEAARTEAAKSEAAKIELAKIELAKIELSKTEAAAGEGGAEAAAPPPNIGAILMERTGVTPAEIQRAAALQKEGEPRHLGEILVEQGAVKAADVVEALRVQRVQRTARVSTAAASDSTIRVDVGLLDKVMNLVGELVLARNQVLLFANRLKDASFLAASQRLNLITTELQAAVMKTRMQPIGNIWGQFPRTVRDVALGCGKAVR